MLADYHQVLSITDESLQDGEKIKITLFYSNLNCFPAVSIGDIIRFHRLKVSFFSLMKCKLVFFIDFM